MNPIPTVESSIYNNNKSHSNYTIEKSDSQHNDGC